MDAESFLYQQMDKYGNELTLISPEELKRDMLEISRKLVRFPALTEVCKKFLRFTINPPLSKDEIVNMLLKAIGIFEH